MSIAASPGALYVEGRQTNNESRVSDTRRDPPETAAQRLEVARTLPQDTALRVLPREASRGRLVKERPGSLHLATVEASII